MTSEQLYEELEHILTKLGVKVWIDPFDEESNSKGGLCTVKGKTVLIINHKLDFNDKNNLMIQSLRTFDLEEVYIKPYIRTTIEDCAIPT